MSDESRFIEIDATVGAVTVGRRNLVLVNGHDITGSVRGFRMECGVDKVTRVWLETIPGETRITVRAAVDDVVIE